MERAVDSGSRRIESSVGELREATASLESRVSDHAAALELASRRAAWPSLPPLPCWRADPADPYDATLLAAAAVCAKLRRAVRVQLGYNMTGGIAHSKIVDKLASAKHKPNRQTVIPRAAVPLVIEDLPLRDVRGLGGQLGERIERRLAVRTAGELARVPRRL